MTKNSEVKGEKNPEKYQDVQKNLSNHLTTHFFFSSLHIEVILKMLQRATGFRRWQA